MKEKAKFVNMFKEIGFSSMSDYYDWKKLDYFYFERKLGELITVDKTIKQCEVIMFHNGKKEINIYGEITTFEYNNCHRELGAMEMKTTRHAIPLDIELLNVICEAKNYLDWKVEE